MPRKKKDKVSKEKSNKKKEIKDSELEEEIEKEETHLGDLEFHDFLKPSNRSFLSVLDKVNQQQPIPQIDNLEEAFPQNTRGREDETANKPKYEIKYEETKYEVEAEQIRLVRNRDIVTAGTERINPMRAGIQINPWIERDIDINPMLGSIRKQSKASSTEERDYIAKTQGRDRDTSLPFQQERKYKGRSI